MRYGFYLPTRGHTATPDAIERLVTRGEALGFSEVVRLVASNEIWLTRGTDGISGLGGRFDPAVINFAAALVRFDACDAVLAYFKEEALERVGPYGLQGGPPRFFGFDDAIAIPAAEAREGAAFVGDVAFSASNVQVTGVDEPDIVKTDGERALALVNGQLHLVSVASGELLDTLDLPDELHSGEMLLAIISDILESNGSSSMATVCGGCLALMDAGVPVRAPVAGIAMGLVREKGKTVILTDILGSEDAYGDMDFKVAGTEKGITSLQMDLKAGGIPLDVTREALEKARQARLFVLGKMKDAIAAPRGEISKFAPRIHKMKIDQEKIGLVIGPGGNTIRGIEEQSGATVEIEDDGTVIVASKNLDALERAKGMIEALTEDLKVGQIYPAKVVSLKDFGAFCEIGNTGRDGLVHVTEITDSYVKSVTDYLQLGMEVEVKLVSTDPNGKNRFSIKQARKDKGLPPLPPLPGANPGGDGGPGGSADDRFRQSRPPGGGRPGGGGRGRGGPPRSGPPRRDRED